MLLNAADMQRRWSQDHLLTPREGAPGAHGSIWRGPLPSDGTGAAAAPASVTSPSPPPSTAAGPQPAPPASTLLPPAAPPRLSHPSSTSSATVILSTEVPWDAVGCRMRRLAPRLPCWSPAAEPASARSPSSLCAHSLVSNPREGCTHKASQRPGADPPSRVNPIGSASGRTGGFSLYLPTYVPHATTHRVRSPQPSAQPHSLAHRW